jgi:hypothetical protein
MAAINNSQIYFSSKLTSFVPENRKKIKIHHPDFFNRTNNIVNQNTDVTQLKVLVDPFLERLFKKRKIDHHFFKVIQKKIKNYFSELEMFLYDLQSVVGLCKFWCLLAQQYPTSWE